jgi:oligoribonuclease (3'-5' exoribonuclease)
MLMSDDVCATQIIMIHTLHLRLAQVRGVRELAKRWHPLQLGQ